MLFQFLFIVNFFSVCLAGILPNNNVEKDVTSSLSVGHFNFSTVEKFWGRIDMSNVQNTKEGHFMKILLSINSNIKAGAVGDSISAIQNNFERLLVLPSLIAEKDSLVFNQLNGSDILSIKGELDDIVALGEQYQGLIDKLSWKNKLFINKAFKNAILSYIQFHAWKINMLNKYVLGSAGTNSYSNIILHEGETLLKSVKYSLLAAIETIEVVSGNSVVAMVDMAKNHFRAFNNETVLIGAIKEHIKGRVNKVSSSDKEREKDMSFLLEHISTIAKSIAFMLLCFGFGIYPCVVFFVIFIPIAIIIWSLILWRYIKGRGL
ncbi:uncharacterized protein NDAI_0E04950 [Naumovozyma dairenensis CBS 421]|uniref:Uncharacterized protein n=1 Tax=Naumovozyma dairenensis (strain ATCC 10597 / BCRC 20456 / CBS 421 / NBRC 0211 / NRRL Y-12639) TaxID=1071378 RepID=G0WAN9_NAUDC|nr:hypothetical protein NDAI_0E04950 [Naumovozyma dairenensis CBS 421]CCD25312.1 hypothetical protein NDAI_0E04950 [Naumovozyma dairenensis CBS 421]